MIDETDSAILDILKDNARTPFLDIAKKLGISESTIRKRVSSLESKTMEFVNFNISCFSIFRVIQNNCNSYFPRSLVKAD